MTTYIEPSGVIEEQLDIAGGITEEQIDYLVDFCIDTKGRVRLGAGIVNQDPKGDDNMVFVPMARFDITEYSHLFEHITIEVPNPASNLEGYTLIRAAWMAEFGRRLERINGGYDEL